MAKNGYYWGCCDVCGKAYTPKWNDIHQGGKAIDAVFMGWECDCEKLTDKVFVGADYEKSDG